MEDGRGHKFYSFVLKSDISEFLCKVALQEQKIEKKIIVRCKLYFRCPNFMNTAHHEYTVE